MKRLWSRLNSVMAEGIRVTDMIQAAEGKAGKAMSLVSAADYRVKIRDAEKTPEEYRHSWQQMLDHLGLFLTQSDIEVTKEGKGWTEKRQYPPADFGYAPGGGQPVSSRPRRQSGKSEAGGSHPKLS